jgi:hypothetical protein
LFDAMPPHRHHDLDAQNLNFAIAAEEPAK